jgi:hypothetical protein
VLFRSAPSRRERLSRPRAFLWLERSAGLPQRFLHDRAELGSILKRFLDGLLNETRDAWGILGCDTLPDLLKLAVRQGDSDLRSGHTIHHTMATRRNSSARPLGMDDGGGVRGQG